MIEVKLRIEVEGKVLDIKFTGEKGGGIDEIVKDSLEMFEMSEDISNVPEDVKVEITKS